MIDKNLKLETIFLSPEYLETRLRDFKDVKSKKVKFVITKSNREGSRTLYVQFWVGNRKVSQLRVSDHIINTSDTQFIVADTILTKKKKAQFVRFVEKSIQRAYDKHLKLAMNWVGYEKSNEYNERG